MFRLCLHHLKLRALDVFRVGSSVLAPLRFQTHLTLRCILCSPNVLPNAASE